MFKKTTITTLKELENKSNEIISVFKETASTFEVLSEQIRDRVAILDDEIMTLEEVRSSALITSAYNDKIANKINSFLKD